MCIFVINIYTGKVYSYVSLFLYIYNIYMTIDWDLAVFYICVLHLKNVIPLQVLRGLAYLREKHQIMHRGKGVL